MLKTVVLLLLMACGAEDQTTSLFLCSCADTSGQSMCQFHAAVCRSDIDGALETAMVACRSRVWPRVCNHESDETFTLDCSCEQTDQSCSNELGGSPYYYYCALATESVN